MKPQIVLVEPRIPQNTGNIGRLCAATQSALHLIHPLGFTLSQKEIKRAGMDYWEHLELYEWSSLEAFTEAHPFGESHFLLTTKAKRAYFETSLPPNAYLYFGREDAGLPQVLLEAHPQAMLKIPMKEGNRSLNLATATGIVLYEAIRQNYPLF
ncbi:tRNA (cytidine(34)-2'-O)-methyltransferase [Wolinella succinogenes]|uniref:tRNA (cytidine(34)-2'-O)-methyltransferase n=1 Tax=Wolinella succinogenes TaxID=844 RepID=UPI00240A96D7|nr:tRNA (cytidine(34)-2'-O)-methyltransferase [Wolinella succinogenes]